MIEFKDSLLNCKILRGLLGIKVEDEALVDKAAKKLSETNCGRTNMLLSS